VLRHAETLFDEPIDPLRFRIVLAPCEMGAYDNHAGWTTANQALPIILLNRHICRICGCAIALNNELNIEDTIVHELTHVRQFALIARDPKIKLNRGCHRDRGWFGAVSEAAPRYLGVTMPVSIWPKQKASDQKQRITEVEVTHWPQSFRRLIANGDSRLASVSPLALAAE
jgi:hypothetical protein